MNKSYLVVGAMLAGVVLFPLAGRANSEAVSNKTDFGVCNADPVYDQAFVGKTKVGSRVRSVACMNGSKILTVLPAGTSIKVLAKTDGWYKVKTSSGLTGWVGSTLINTTDAKWTETKSTVKNVEVKKVGNFGTAVSEMEKLSLQELYLLKEKVLKKIELAEQKQVEEQKKLEEKKVTVEEVSSNSQGSILLKGESGLNAVKLNWALSNMTSKMGFKVVVADHENPVYPGDEYHYLTDANIRADEWGGLRNGVHYFRVCEYLGGKCGVYSNNIKVTVSE